MDICREGVQVIEKNTKGSGRRSREEYVNLKWGQMIDGSESNNIR